VFQQKLLHSKRKKYTYTITYNIRDTVHIVLTKSYKSVPYQMKSKPKKVQVLSIKKETSLLRNHLILLFNPHEQFNLNDVCSYL